MSRLLTRWYAAAAFLFFLSAVFAFVTNVDWRYTVIAGLVCLVFAAHPWKHKSAAQERRDRRNEINLFIRYREASLDDENWSGSPPALRWSANVNRWLERYTDNVAVDAFNGLAAPMTLYSRGQHIMALEGDIGRAQIKWLRKLLDERFPPID